MLCLLYFLLSIICYCFFYLIDSGIKSKTADMVSPYALFIRHSALSTAQV